MSTDPGSIIKEYSFDINAQVECSVKDNSYIIW